MRTALQKNRLIRYNLTVPPHSHIAPGGYIEHSEPTPEFMSDDGSIAPDDVLHRLTGLAVEAGEKFGKNMLIAPHIKNMIEEAGFVNIVERRYKWPLGEWPVDHKLKDIGRWNLQHWLEGLDAWTLRLLTQYCGVSQHSIPSPIFQSHLGHELARRAMADWRVVDA